MTPGIKLELSRLCPINNWQEDTECEYWTVGEKRPRHITDVTTGDKYLNQSNKREKCAILIFGSIFQLIPMIAIIVFRILRLVSFYHFWKKSEDSEYNLKGRFIDLGKDSLRILASPFVFIFLQMAAIEGIFRPFDGAKVYANLELAYYGFPVMSPCFQRDGIKHFLGGSIDDPRAW